MKTVLVSLPSVEKVKEFNTKIFPLEGDFDLGTGRYIVDARSSWVFLVLTFQSRYHLPLTLIMKKK